MTTALRAFSSRTDWDLTPNPLHVRREALAKRGVRVIDLTESNPTRCGFAYPLRAVLGPLGESDNLVYDPNPRGLLRAREAVCSYYKEKGFRLSPDDVVLTASTSEAYSFLLRLLADPGDGILVPRPSYPLLEYLAKLSDVELQPYRLTVEQRWSIDFSTLKQAVGENTRALALVNPNNPTGSFVSAEERRALALFAHERGLAVIADEVFLDYPHGDKRASARSWCGTRDVLTFVLSGASKVLGLPQMKIAWIVVCGPRAEAREALRRLEVIADTFLSVSTPAQHALAHWFKFCPEIQGEIRQRIRENFSVLAGEIGPLGSGRVFEPEGGWVAIVELPRGLSEEAWALKFLEKDHVLVHPGYFYDFESDGCVVMSLLLEPDLFREVVRRLRARVERES